MQVRSASCHARMPHPAWHPRRHPTAPSGTPRACLHAGEQPQVVHAPCAGAAATLDCAAQALVAGRMARHLTQWQPHAPPRQQGKASNVHQHAPSSAALRFLPKHGTLVALASSPPPPLLALTSSAGHCSFSPSCFFTACAAQGVWQHMKAGWRKCECSASTSSSSSSAAWNAPALPTTNPVSARMQGHQSPAPHHRLRLRVRVTQKHVVWPLAHHICTRRVHARRMLHAHTHSPPERAAPHVHTRARTLARTGTTTGPPVSTTTVGRLLWKPAASSSPQQRALAGLLRGTCVRAQGAAQWRVAVAGRHGGAATAAVWEGPPTACERWCTRVRQRCVYPALLRGTQLAPAYAAHTFTHAAACMPRPPAHLGRHGLRLRRLQGGEHSGGGHRAAAVQ